MEIQIGIQQDTTPKDNEGNPLAEISQSMIQLNQTKYDNEIIWIKSR